MKMNHDKKVDGRTMAVGDTVNVKNFSHGPKWMPDVVVKVTGPVCCEVLLSDERVVRVTGPVSCEVLMSDERVVRVIGPVSYKGLWSDERVVRVIGSVSCEVLLSDERVVRRRVDHIQRRHTDRPKEAERQLPPSVPEATHLPDDSHGTPECPPHDEIQPRGYSPKRQRAARCCGFN